MPILILSIGIILITGLSAFGNRVSPIKICPICAGVSGAWLLAYLGILLGKLPLSDYFLPIAILMGGTVVGIAYQGEKRFAWAQKSIFRFRAPVVIVGFLLVYFAVGDISWVGFGLEVIILGFFTYLYFIRGITSAARRDGAAPDRIKEIEEKMKECC